MAKRRRKRRKAVAEKKSKLPRQESILHAIRCSTDVDWLKEVSLVSRDRYSKACAQKTERELAEKWEYLRTYCKPGTWVVVTNTDGGTEFCDERLLQVRRFKLRELAIECRAAGTSSNLGIVTFDRATALRRGLVALASLPEDQREPFEAQLFEAGLEKVGHAFHS